MDLVAWARTEGLEVVEPPDYVVASEVTSRSRLLATRTSEFDFTTNPCVDFGRLVERIPACVLRPVTVEQLAACLAAVSRRGLGFVLRGAAHTSGGQVLIDGGIVVDTSRLARVVVDDPDGDTITVEGGMTWLSLVEHLAPQGRRPPVLTDNLRTTVAGTLAVGGIGDTSHRLGFQAEHVRRLELVTPRGDLVSLTPADELFPYVLGGSGLLGAIARVELSTHRRSFQLAARKLRWPSLHAYARDAASIASYGLFEYFRARVRWAADGTTFVDGLIGRFGDQGDDASALALIAPSEMSPLATEDYLAFLRRDRTRHWTYASPALELVLPMPHGLDLFCMEQRRLFDANIVQRIPIGASVVLLPRARLPLLPSPASDYGLLVALRPQMTVDEAHAALPILEAFARRAIDAGARIYNIGVRPNDIDVLRAIAGDHYDRFSELKRSLDPLGACNLPPQLVHHGPDRS